MMQTSSSAVLLMEMYHPPAEAGRVALSILQLRASTPQNMNLNLDLISILIARSLYLDINAVKGHSCCSVSALLLFHNTRTVPPTLPVTKPRWRSVLALRFAESGQPWPQFDNGYLYRTILWVYILQMPLAPCYEI